MINIQSEIIIELLCPIFIINLIGYFYLIRLKKGVDVERSIKLAINYFTFGLLFHLAVIVLILSYYCYITYLVGKHLG